MAQLLIFSWSRVRILPQVASEAKKPTFVSALVLYNTLVGERLFNSPDQGGIEGSDWKIAALYLYSYLSMSSGNRCWIEIQCNVISCYIADTLPGHLFVQLLMSLMTYWQLLWLLVYQELELYNLVYK